MGFSLPGPGYLFGAILFGFIGFAAWRYGGRTKRPIVRWTGLALMLYPYLISETWLLYVVGVALCALAVVFRE